MAIDVSLFTANLLVIEGQRNIFHGIFERDQVKRLKNETQQMISQGCRFPFIQFTDGRPVEVIFPGIIIIKDPRIFSKVDFPDPDAPITETISPALISRSIPFST